MRLAKRAKTPQRPAHNGQASQAQPDRQSASQTKIPTRVKARASLMKTLSVQIVTVNLLYSNPKLFGEVFNKVMAKHPFSHRN
jgi:hypothetical protein